MRKRIVLLGAPGCGKGSQAAKLKEEYGLPHISTGDLFRDNIKKGTPLGLKVKEIINAGKLCPDELTIALVEDRLKSPDCQKGYILDGFPRNIFQAEELDRFAPPDVVINLTTTYEEIVRRISGRRLCSGCGAIYHIDNLSDDKVCPKCGADLYTRKDDNVETVKERVKVYHEQTEPLIGYYEKQGKLFHVVSITVDHSFDIITKEILK